MTHRVPDKGSGITGLTSDGETGERKLHASTNPRRPAIVTPTNGAVARLTAGESEEGVREAIAPL